jgi:hypothetical protein
LGQKPQSQQQRKKRVMEEVQRQRRRQRTFTLMLIGAVLVAIIVGGVYFLTHQTSSNLPPYLAECVNGSLAYHSHAHLAITINGANQPVPGQIGINGACLHPLHTHSTDGVIHVEPDQNRTFLLSDFFLVWGQPFNSTQLLSQKYTTGLSMTVNGVPDSSFWNYAIPRNAQYTSQNACSQTSCQEVDIKITLNAS